MNSDIQIKKSRIKGLALICIILSMATGFHLMSRDALNFPGKNWGVSFGNSKNFSGIRFNFIDKNIEIINGINFTLWRPKEGQMTGTVNGLSAGINPSAKNLYGIQLGILGVGAGERMSGINLGLIGAGAGEHLSGFNVGGIGVGAGGDIIGISLGGIGVGAGGNLTGINLGGIGAGAGNDMTGINIGGLGVGAGENMTGLNIGGFGVGAGRNLTGINLGGIGIGSGERVTGISIGGIGVGAGERLTGLTIGGIGVGSPEIRGLTIAGAAIGGKRITGISAALGTVMIKDDGVIKGLSISAFNFIKGTQRGVAIGIVNYAYRLRGVQIGLINIVRDNPPGRIILPVINWNF